MDDDVFLKHLLDQRSLHPNSNLLSLRPFIFRQHLFHLLPHRFLTSHHAYCGTLPTTSALMPDEPAPSGSQGSSPTGTNSSLSSADRFDLDANDTRKILVYEYRGGPVKTTSQQELCRTLDKGIAFCAASKSPPTND